MVIANCNECGQEYELDKGETPSEYQCACGGDLVVSPPIQKDQLSTNGSDKKRKWNDIYKARMEERQEERIERNKKHKRPPKPLSRQLAGPLVGLIIAIVLLTTFGIIGLLIGLLILFLIRDV